MFTDSRIFTAFQPQRVLGASWLAVLPGAGLTLMALAILVWPELLAYMVAGVLLFAGISLLSWGWALRQAERRSAERTYVQYRIY